MKYIIIIISIGFALFPSVTLAAASCAVETQPSQAFMEYKKNVDTVMKNIREYAGANKSCGTGFTSQSKRAIDSIDASLNKGFTIFDVVTDFRYNFELLDTGEPRGPVKREGAFLTAIEKQILSTITYVGTQCALDLTPSLEAITKNLPDTATKPSGGTLEEILDALIQNHKSLEVYFKKVSIGESSASTTFALTSTKFTSDISANYHPDMIAKCKPQSGEKSPEVIIDRLMNVIALKGKTTEKGLESWKEAIALLEGNAKKTTDLNLEKKLLARELSRQGVSGKGRELIMRNLKDYNSPTSSRDDSSIAARFTRWVNNTSTALSEGVENALASTIPKSKTTSEWVRNVNNVRYQKTVITPIVEEYNKAKLLLSDEVALDTKMITDLVDLHIKLSQTNAELVKVIPRIQKLCEKQLPGYGNCRYY